MDQRLRSDHALISALHSALAEDVIHCPVWRSSSYNALPTKKYLQIVFKVWIANHRKTIPQKIMKKSNKAPSRHITMIHKWNEDGTMELANELR